MSALPSELRKQLERTITEARAVAEAGARTALQSLAVHHHAPYNSMTEEQQALRNRLRAHGRRLGDRRDPTAGTQAIDRLAEECAYEHWHRMLFARFLAENHLLIEPTSGVAITMEECKELAGAQGLDPWALAGRFAQRMLPQVFRADDPVLEVVLPPEARQILERLLAELPAIVFTADDSLGWTYQFWQSAEKARVNERVKSGEKITGRTLPAVTQRFTDSYMVQFLLHNTIGAWHAAKVLSQHPDLARTARTELELRNAVSLKGYSFEYLRFVRYSIADADGQSESSTWGPASGQFGTWPAVSRELRVLDPCCGSGHFLVAAFELLVRLRMSEERLSLTDAIRKVLEDNLFGLELDPRCTQIAAFNLALTAWRMAGRVIDLPPLNIACSGLSIGAPKHEWLELAGTDSRLRLAMEQLHALFDQAPEVGSLIDPWRTDAEDKLFSVDLRELQPLLQKALRRRDVTVNEDRRELGVAAQGIAKAAELLAGRYHLVITNVPFKYRGELGGNIREFCDEHYPFAKHDLATVFMERCLRFCPRGGTVSIVLPQNWLFQTSYRLLREKLLTRDTWHLVAWLGSGAFEVVTGEVVKAILLNISRGQAGKDAGHGNMIAAIDASKSRQPAEKAVILRDGEVNRLEQMKQFENPDARVVFDEALSEEIVAAYAPSLQGISPADLNRYGRKFWEISFSLPDWLPWQSSTKQTVHYGGRELALWWDQSLREAFSQGGAYLRGREAWGKLGVAVRQVGQLPCTLYSGTPFDTNCAVVLPYDTRHLPAIWCFCSSQEYHEAVRRIDRKLNVTNATLAKVPFNLEYWQQVAQEKYPRGLPKPYSDDPTQWVFHGHPCGSVIWDEERKWTAHGPIRTDSTVLQVAVARLLGYRWPAELDSEMELSDETREWVARCEDLLPYADADGIVCLSPVRGEASAADRLRRLLAAAYGSEWSPVKERQLLEADSPSGRPCATIEGWLRDRFFEEHCKLFHHRPFIWHVWDGRADGFHALVNYQRLVGPDGEGRRTLEALTYSYLGDWIERQRAEQREGREGAEGRLAAALDLQEQLTNILTGEPPCDIFIRWKPLHQQPIGWEPDINDGVRLNIRPFMQVQLRKGGRAGAGILRWKPNIHWKKDRGQEVRVLRPSSDYPWFWGCDPETHLEHRTDFMGGRNFDGNRWNNLHYTNKVKQAARERYSEEARA